ncbi:MAG TPA: hypothetical protein VK582_01365 [Pyrinomonadaceae bacterium]|nr:hypothetical protein [Pyrinomonadaceae bacterium]
MVLFLGVLTTQNNASSNNLERAVFAEQERSFTTAEAFHASLNRARVPGGMVTIVGCQEDTLKRNWKPQGQALGQVLNEIVGADRSYRWETQDGAVNLLPTSGEPPLLQTRIGEFSIKTNSSLDALSELEKRTEMKEAMINLHLQGGLTIIMYSPSPTEFSVRFKEGTLRQALNAIAVSRGTDIWTYREIHCGERNEATIKF